MTCVMNRGIESILLTGIHCTYNWCIYSSIQSNLNGHCQYFGLKYSLLIISIRKLSYLIMMSDMNIEIPIYHNAEKKAQCQFPFTFHNM